MKKYIGTKTIMAKPMAKSEAEKVLKKIEQKPAEWSEEDEQHVDSLLKRLEGLCRNEFERTRFAINEDKDWLKSLKNRIQPKQELSEEDDIICAARRLFLGGRA